METVWDGAANGLGGVFKLAADGTYTLLNSFGSSPGDGALPASGLISDKSGNMYGTTAGDGGSIPGSVYKITPQGQETTLYTLGG